MAFFFLPKAARDWRLRYQNLARQAAHACVKWLLRDNYAFVNFHIPTTRWTDIDTFKSNIWATPLEESKAEQYQFLDYKI